MYENILKSIKPKIKSTVSNASTTTLGFSKVSTWLNYTLNNNFPQRVFVNNNKKLY